MKHRVLNTFIAIASSLLLLVSCADNCNKDLPRKQPSRTMTQATSDYIKAIEEEGQGIQFFPELVLFHSNVSERQNGLFLSLL